MSKPIRLEDHVYYKLDNFRDKNETRSQAVERLLGAWDEVRKLADILEGAAKFRESQEEKRDEQRRGN